MNVLVVKDLSLLFLLFVIKNIVSKDLISFAFHMFFLLILAFSIENCNIMAKGTNKQFSILSTRQITHTRLYDDASLETRYEILNKLGEGSFGTVFRVRNKETDLFYAMKTIAKKVYFVDYLFQLLPVFFLAGK